MTNHVPPGPKSAILGFDFAARFSRDPLTFLIEMTGRKDPLIYLRMGPVHGYIANAPEIVHEVLVTKAKHFQKWAQQKRVFGKFDGDGLVNSDGEFWRRQRKLVQPAFHTKRIREYADVMVAFTQRQIATWQPGQPINVGEQMAYITRNIVTKTLFNSDVAAEQQRIGECIEHIQYMAFREMGLGQMIPDWVPFKYSTAEKQAMADLDALIHRFIRERRESGEDHGDLLSMLLMAEDDKGERMTDVQARDEAMTLFIAGYETTATALTWAWYLLGQHPEAMGLLLEEVDSALRGRLPTFEDLPKLRYTEWVIKEAMRLYPPTWMFPREVAEQVEIGGYPLKVGAMVYLIPYTMHRDSQLFPQAEAFMPERFAPDAPKPIPDFAYFPFGGGPRVCIGNAFAMMEMRLLLATIAQQFRLFPLPERPAAVPEALITLRPKGGLHMAPVPRLLVQEEAHTEMAQV
jgi:cytochrome P450